MTAPAFGPYHHRMEIIVDLLDDDVAFLDAHARAHGLGSRSAVVRKAVRLLRTAELGPAYVAAWQEWEDAGESDAWDAYIGDEIADAAR